MDEPEGIRASDPEAFRPRRPTHWLTRALLLRLLGLVYAVAFAVVILQFRALLGSGGLLPIERFLADEALPLELPTLFSWNASDGFALACAWLGLLGSLAVVAGATNALLMGGLWALYLSFVHVGQVFYGYGWEILLLEAGFLAVFWCPLRGWRPFPAHHPPPELLVWLYRWLAFRVLFGAGLIKLRGDECWRDLSCLRFHYETQPNPHPLSWLWHQMPPAFHTVGVLFNHFVELVVPFAVFAPRPYRTVAGVLLVVFQIGLILSGNLSFLNWLTLAVCIACFDDEPLVRALPRRARERVRAWLDALRRRAEPGRGRRWALAVLAVVVGILSIQPVVNLLSPRQAMNRSFDPFHLVNTYGAFGAIDRERYELVIQGTLDEDPSTASWQDYELPCKPGDVNRAPCFVTPYHLRLDWEMWWPFNRRGPRLYLLRLAHALLEGEPLARTLLAHDPFAGRPPRWLRIARYRYRFTRWGEPGWWRREHVDVFVRPLARGDPALIRALGLPPPAGAAPEASSRPGR